MLIHVHQEKLESLDLLPLINMEIQLPSINKERMDYHLLLYSIQIQKLYSKEINPLIKYQ